MQTARGQLLPGPVERGRRAGRPSGGRKGGVREASWIGPRGSQGLRAEREFFKQEEGGDSSRQRDVQVQQFEGKREPGESAECTEVSCVWTRVGSGEEAEGLAGGLGRARLVEDPGFSPLFPGPWLPKGDKQKCPSSPKALLYGGSFSLTALCPKKFCLFK